MEKVYLELERHDVNAAELAGAAWDEKRKRWFFLVENLQSWKYPEILRNLKDDRDFGGNLLCVDLIPKPCWGENVEHLIGEEKFDLLGNCVNIRVNYICEFCKTRTGLVTVGKWEYDERIGIRTLKRLVGLCGKCVDATHLGRASIQENRNEAITHLKNVRNFTDIEAAKHIENAYALWRRRNQIAWYSDISILEF